MHAPSLEGQLRQKNAAHVGFEKLEKTAEYVETTWYKRKGDAKFSNDVFSGVYFFCDHLKYLLDGGATDPNKKFLSCNLRNFGYYDMIAALGWVDLPIHKGDEKSYKIQSDGKRGIFISSEQQKGSIIFKREVKEGSYEKQQDLIIIHRYTKAHETESEVTDFLVNTPYRCEVIMTNVSSKPKQMTLLFQIPNGSLPLRSTKYIESQTINIQPYSTSKQAMLFYFPADGAFEHFPTNVSENSLVVAKSTIHKLVVGKKRVITKVETFIDEMISAGTIENKKKIILDMLRERSINALVSDTKYNFSFKMLESYLS